MASSTLSSRMWVDTHCHLQLTDRDPAALLQAAPDVSWLVAPGVDAASSEASVRLAERFPTVLATTGLHPHDAEHWDSQRGAIERLLPFASAIGETGLDYYRNLSPPEDQRRAFGDQLQLAGDHDLPIIIHCRDAFADVYDMVELAEAGERAILHCWTGGPRWSKRFLELGVTFSFAGPVAFETGDTVRRGAAIVPPHRAMVETDTPYLAPPPHRGEDNEPAHVALVGAALAGVWGLPVEKVAELTSAKAAEVFGRHG